MGVGVCATCSLQLAPPERQLCFSLIELFHLRFAKSPAKYWNVKRSGLEGWLSKQGLSVLPATLRLLPIAASHSSPDQIHVWSLRILHILRTVWLLDRSPQSVNPTRMLLHDGEC